MLVGWLGVCVCVCVSKIQSKLFKCCTPLIESVHATVMYVFGLSMFASQVCIALAVCLSLLCVEREGVDLSNSNGNTSAWAAWRLVYKRWSSRESKAYKPKLMPAF